ncbi:hypothetical protein [Pseudomonas sp.]|uniref:hypothetical protein n=1 Tax=Pseudomonas sp. TaxID=306 RepID=UPI003FD74511
MSEFDELLAKLNAAQEEQTTLAKALPAADGKDDKTIQTAAADGVAGDKKNPEDDEPELDADGKPLIKSLGEGQEFEVIDGEALIKSLTDLSTRADASESVLAKGMAGLLELVKGQNLMFKSMQDQITKLSGQGAGRKTMISILDKPVVGEPLAKSLAEPTFTRADLMAKANAAFDAKKITGHELTTIDVSLREGVMLDKAILAKCF